MKNLMMLLLWTSVLLRWALKRQVSLSHLRGTLQLKQLRILGGMFTLFIHHNTPLPAKISHTFTTSADNQASVLVQVFEGENK